MFGEYRAPTGVSGGVGHRGAEFRSVLARSQAMAERTGGPPRLLVAKPGLDGHSNGAEQIAVARPGCRIRGRLPGHPASPAEIAAAARDEDVDVIGISILSGAISSWSPRWLTGFGPPGWMPRWWWAESSPPKTPRYSWARGWPAVYTPKDFEIGQIMDDMLGLAEEHRASPVG